MSKSMLDDLVQFKIPALEFKIPALEGGVRLVGDGPRILLFSRSGFSAALTDAAETDDRISLIDLATLVTELDRELT